MARCRGPLMSGHRRHPIRCSVLYFIGMPEAQTLLREVQTSHQK